jgi:4-diphosphocytidyl-2-C-methyl-D-erythritol kinase
LTRLPGEGIFPGDMQTLTRLSPAKINLTLRVTGRRPDGFHDLESLVACVTLADRITIMLTGQARWTVTCSDPAIPCDECNLAVRAAVRFAERVGEPVGGHIDIQKRIPAGSGLGGGSSNAATVLAMLNDLLGARLAEADLVALGAEIGSDVPLFFRGPLCVMRGRGELVEPVEARLATELLLFLPGIHSATPAVYAAWDRRGGHSVRPEVGFVVAGLAQPARLADLLFNDLEEPAVAISRELADFASALRAACPLPVWMSGSGSAFFCLDAEGSPAITVAENKLRQAMPDLRVERVRVWEPPPADQPAVSTSPR